VRTDPELLRGGDSARNAELLLATLGAGMPTGPDAGRVAAIRDAVAVNASAAMVAHAAAVAAASGLAPDGRDLTTRVGEQLPLIRGVMAAGAALDVLTGWVAVSRELRG
jgi:anthranilate phosphoribosyltransferase